MSVSGALENCLYMELFGLKRKQFQGVKNKLRNIILFDIIIIIISPIFVI